MTAGPSQPQPPAAPLGTPDAPRIAVRGQAHLEVDPELARIAVTVAARGTDRRTALDDLSRRNAAVLELIKTYTDAVERLETGALSLSPELSARGRGERVRAYHGHARIDAELNDFTALGELTTRLADLELTRVDGPWWALRPGSPVHRTARQQAVREAVQRAREYAEALGTTLTALVELADTGAEHPQPYAYGGRSMPRSPGAVEEAGGRPLPIDLEPQRQHVHAQVNARFVMAPPRL